MDIFICILTIMGIALIFYWGGIGVKSAFRNPFASSTNLERIETPLFLTSKKHAYVRESFLDVKSKKYIAEVVCPELGRRSLPVAETKERLWQLCEERITEFEKEKSENRHK